MDNNNNQSVPKHVQVEENKKPEKKYVIFYNATNKEGEVPTYVSVNGVMAAFAKMVELKQQGVISIVVYQEVQLKVSVS